MRSDALTLHPPRLVVAGADETGRIVAEMIAIAVTARRDIVLGLATGSSVEPAYAALAAMQVDLSAARAFALDEYIGLDLHDAQRYRSTLERALPGRRGIRADRLYTPDVDAGDLDAAAAHYDQLIAASGGVDVQLLGIGVNGHIAFNEPGAPWDRGTHVTDLTESTRRANARFFRSLADVPRRAITQGIETILRARHLVLMAQGAAKGEALRRAFHGAPDPQVPASALQQHPNVTVVVDDAAAESMRARPDRTSVSAPSP